MTVKERKKYNRRYYKKHRAEILRQRRDYYQNNREERREYQRGYWLSHARKSRSKWLRKLYEMLTCVCRAILCILTHKR